VYVYIILIYVYILLLFSYIYLFHGIKNMCLLFVNSDTRELDIRPQKQFMPDERLDEISYKGNNVI
jgi:hypothetical protein